MLMYSFLVADTMNANAYKVISGQGEQSQLKSASVGLLGLTVTGSVLLAIEEYIRTSVGNYFFISYMLLHIVNSGALCLFVLSKGSIIFLSAFIAVHIACLIPCSLLCFYFPEWAVETFNLGSASSLQFIIIQVVLSLLSVLDGTICHIHFVPCIVLMFIMAPAISNEIVTTTGSIIKTTHFLAVGVGASVNTLVEMNEQSLKVYAGAMTAGGGILTVVQKSSFLQGAAGALLGPQEHCWGYRWQLG